MKFTKSHRQVKVEMCRWPWGCSKSSSIYTFVYVFSSKFL